MVTLNPNQPVSASGLEIENRGIASSEPAVTRNYMLMRSYLSWGSIIAGSVFTLAVLILSASFAIACRVPGYTGGIYGWGSFIWALVTAAVAFYCGACIASYFAPAADGRFRYLHGIMSWGLTVPLLGLFYLGTSTSLLSHTAILVNGTTVGLVLTNAAVWGSFLSLVVGICFAAIGASTGSTLHDRMIMGSR